MKIHGNSLHSPNLHHLYEIVDAEENDVFKYGISGDSLLKDGTSARANEQVNLFNLVVNRVRFYANVLLTDIKGRAEAERLENEYIEAYEKQHGQKPRGNRE